MKKTDGAVTAEMPEVAAGNINAGAPETGQRIRSWLVTVENSPNYCGIGAGSVQFANGRAVIRSERMARWFREHEGYKVTEQ